MLRRLLHPIYCNEPYKNSVIEAISRFRDNGHPKIVSLLSSHQLPNIFGDSRSYFFIMSFDQNYSQVTCCNLFNTPNFWFKNSSFLKVLLCASQASMKEDMTHRFLEHLAFLITEFILLSTYLLKRGCWHVMTLLLNICIKLKENISRRKREHS